MSEPTQKLLFTYICSEEGHNFGVVGDGYYKRDSADEPIKDKVYRMILCNKCGEAKEICIRDRSQVVEKKTRKRVRK